MAAIFFFVFREAAPVLFGELNLWEFFTSQNWIPSSEVRPQYGILALLVGTLSVTGLAMLLAVPLGLGAAVYISEFCSGKVRETLKVVIELLAAIPSIVWGFVGYMVIGPVIIEVTGRPVGINLLNGGIILALMSVPVIVSVGEDALKAVPDSYREAALALGASRWEIVYRVLFPAAKNGLLAAVLAGRRPRHRRDHGRVDGHRTRRANPHQPAGPHPHADRDDGGGIGGGGRRRDALPRAVRDRVGAVCRVVCGQPHGGPHSQGNSQ